MSARCKAPGCAVTRRPRAQVCEAHWRALPGKWRTRLSLVVGRSPVLDDMWARAIAAIPKEAA